MSYYNPFQNLELRIPEAYREEVDRFCQTQPGGGRRPPPDDSPFERQIDIWFLAVCLGARKGKRTEAKLKFEKVLKLNPSHIGARTQLSGLK